MRSRFGAAVLVPLLAFAVLPSTLATSAQQTFSQSPASLVESAWEASFGPGAGDAVIRAFDTEAGSFRLSLRGLVPKSDYAVGIQGGICPARGPQVLSAGTFRSTSSGTLSAARPLTVADVEVIRDAASGTGRISVLVGRGAGARCATLAKSLSVTPQIWFAPLPPMPLTPWRSFVGSTDFGALFASDAAWPRVAGRTHVFKFYGEWLDTTVTDTELRRVVAALKARGIAIAIEIGPLTAAGCGEGVEGFNDGSATTLRLIHRVTAAGGTVRYVAMDEPYYFGSLYEGENACRWSTAKVAQKVARYVREVKAVYPSVSIGDIEPLAGTATAEQYQAWMAAVRSATGAPLPFFHLDLDWGRGDWAASALRLQSYARGHGVRFGIIYNSALASSDAEWLAAAQSHILAYELDGAGPPDDAVFQSWTDHPDRVLPESGPDTFTHLIADYTRQRTSLAIDAPAPTDAGRLMVGGQVRTLGGMPIAGAQIDVAATPRDGAYQVFAFTGTVPAGASQAVIGIRVNTEGAGAGSADLTFYEIGYAEGADGVNLVPNARFDQGLEGLDCWAPYVGDGNLVVVASDHDDGSSMLRTVVAPVQTLSSNSCAFSVTPGAEYRLWFAARIPEASMGSAYVAPIFLNGDWADLGRDVHPLAPAPIAVGVAVTGAMGRFSLTTDVLEAGRYRLQATYPGDTARWPAWARAEVVVP